MCGQSEHIIGSPFDFNPTIVVRPSQTVIKCDRLYDTFFLHYYYCIIFGLLLILTFDPAAILLLKESLDIFAMTYNKTYLKWLYVQSDYEGHEEMLLLLLSIKKHTNEVNEQLDQTGWTKPSSVMKTFPSSQLHKKIFEPSIFRLNSPTKLPNRPAWG